MVFRLSCARETARLKCIYGVFDQVTLVVGQRTCSVQPILQNLQIAGVHIIFLLSVLFVSVFELSAIADSIVFPFVGYTAYAVNPMNASAAFMFRILFHIIFSLFSTVCGRF